MPKTNPYTLYRYQCLVCKIWQTGEVKETNLEDRYLKCCVKYCENIIFGEEAIEEITQATVGNAIKPIS